MKDNQTVSLFIDTATKALAVGAIKGETYLTVDMADPKKALERTHLGIEYLMDRVGFALADVDNFFCLLGPGSNTGIRLGLAIPRTIYGINPKIHVFGVPTMELVLCEVKDGVSVLSDRGGNLFVGKKVNSQYSYEKVTKADIDTKLKDYPHIYVEKEDTLAHEELKDHQIIDLNVLSLMMNHPTVFKDFSSQEEDYLPEYALKI